MILQDPLLVLVDLIVREIIIDESNCKGNLQDGSKVRSEHYTPHRQSGAVSNQVTWYFQYDNPKFISTKTLKYLFRFQNRYFLTIV